MAVHSYWKQYYFPVLFSTMDTAREIAAGSADDVFAVRAGHQTQGRGRRGKIWTDMSDASLLVTIAARRTCIAGGKNLSDITLRMAAAVIAALRRLPIHAVIQIKWPNDILCSNQKLCGILVETDTQWCYVGIGLNVQSAPSSAAALNRVLPAKSSFSAHDFWRYLEPYIAFFLQNVCWWDIISQSFAWIGETVTVHREDAPCITGTVQGIAHDGSLLLRLQNNITQNIYSGTVSPIG